MLFANERVVKALFEQLPSIKVSRHQDKEFQEQSMDQLGEAVKLGGRTFVFVYILSLIIVPRFISKVPSHIFRWPMGLLLIFKGESIFFIGAELAVKRQSARIYNELLRIPEGPLKDFADSLNK